MVNKGSLSAAADTKILAQPAVSHQLKRLCIEPDGDLSTQPYRLQYITVGAGMVAKTEQVIEATI
ncbi:hypothetical protein GCM10007939_14450 [Amylibacter marinus]|uniref:Uncharacterized protein n=1 Tax=Amylibacter marinus TaxID=1475483 RepID=A0ABQ5VVF2_9RHOB|nr:LysR family transcriptional regulator [Amylibacter marinus]GLQ35162.1 hypothetical protein GCM10007939_14450 [Amylibacter marinus]